MRVHLLGTDQIPGYHFKTVSYIAICLQIANINILTEYLQKSKEKIILLVPQQP